MHARVYNVDRKLLVNHVEECRRTLFAMLSGTLVATFRDSKHYFEQHVRLSHIACNGEYIDAPLLP